MRHRKSGRKLGRNASHRHALFRNMVTSLLEHERITTTEAKAKELRSFAEKTISISLRLGDLLTKPQDQRSPTEQSRYVHALRMAGRMIRSRTVLQKLFTDIGPYFKGRAGGYTRIIKTAPRVGDCAPMAVIELVGRKDEKPSTTTA